VHVFSKVQCLAQLQEKQQPKQLAILEKEQRKLEKEQKKLEHEGNSREQKLKA